MDERNGRDVTLPTGGVWFWDENGIPVTFWDAEFGGDYICPVCDGAVIWYSVGDVSKWTCDCKR